MTQEDNTRLAKVAQPRQEKTVSWLVSARWLAIVASKLRAQTRKRTVLSVKKREKA